MWTRVLARLTTLVLLAPGAQAFAQSCAMCASSFGPNDPRQRAFNWSILFLMAAPYTIFGSAVLCLVILYRRGASRRRAPVIELPWARRAGARPLDPEEA
ncbi:MAG TPA: hypothetical protein VKW76_01890 [Candidatus Binatia bacterium]|nr:hypothetical protein [Candidatus Binatia bacterium]